MVYYCGRRSGRLNERDRRHNTKPMNQNTNADDGDSTEQVTIPESAMEVNHGIDSDHGNYVLFPVTDVIEWYTEHEDGSVSVERFVANEPDHPEDIPLGLEGWD